MLYYIDGYNLMFRASRGLGDFKSSRQNFIEELNEKIQTVLLDAVIVFDAQYQFGLGSRSRYRHLTVCFTDTGETADDYIIDEIKSSSKPRQIILVTSDKNLAWRARQYHSKTISVEDFVATLETQFKKKLKGEKKKLIPPPPQKVISEQPVVHQEESFNFYLIEFEKRFKEATKDEKPREKYVSDTNRWLDIFEKRMKGEIDEDPF
jgi:predicted RNA-binding protein with PIN domain